MGLGFFSEVSINSISLIKDLILSFREFQSLAPLKAKERCPVDRRHKGMSKAPDNRVCLLQVVRIPLRKLDT